MLLYYLCQTAAKQDFCQNSDSSRSRMECLQEEKLSIWQELSIRHGNLSSHHTENRTTGPQCLTAIYAHTRDIYVEKCPVSLYKTLGQNMRVSHSGMGWFLIRSPDCFNSEIPCKLLSLLYLLIVCWAHKVLVSSAVVGKSLGLIKVLVRRDTHRRAMVHPTCILWQPHSLTHTQPDLSSFHRS